MKEKGSIESLCIFNEDGECYLHAGKPSECKLCFNFLTPYRIPEFKRTKPLYTLFDYLESKGYYKALFPSDDSVQTTL